MPLKRAKKRVKPDQIYLGISGNCQGGSRIFLVKKFRKLVKI